MTLITNFTISNHYALKLNTSTSHSLKQPKDGATPYVKSKRLECFKDTPVPPINKL